MTGRDQTQKPANDDAAPAVTAISLTDLAAMSGIDEDTLLQRLAGIMDARVEKAEAGAKPKVVAKP